VVGMGRHSPLEIGRIICYSGIACSLILPNFVPIPVFAQVLSITFFIIYVGAHNSVQNQQGSKGKLSDVMQTKDVAMFPIIGSCVLFGLYLVFKFFNKDYVNMLLKVYFFIFGVIALVKQISVLSTGIVPVSLLNALDNKTYRIKIPFNSKKNGAPLTDEDFLIFTNLEVVASVISMGVGAWYTLSNHWASSNIFGIAFSIQGIELLSLGTFRNGCILLAGLFVYDVFWVFGTEVMVSVARSFDAPIKLLFPQMVAGESPSMLGLGDIVIPGIFIAILLRYDYYQLNMTKLTDDQIARCASPFTRNRSVFTIDWKQKPFFWSCMVWYVIGLATTLGCMYFFKAAQPALLYLVPACLGSSSFTAWRRREFTPLLAYKEEGVIPAVDLPLSGTQPVPITQSNDSGKKTA